MDPHVQAAFAAMEAQLLHQQAASAQQAQQHQLQQMQFQQQMAELQQAAAAAAQAAAAPAAPHGPSMRIAAPAHYTGSAPPLDDWLAAMRQQFEWYGYAHDLQRVRAAAAHLKGAALDWWEHPGAGGAPVT